MPVHVPLIDLLPALLGHLGENLADTGLEHDGWVLQRLGDPPLREELSVAALGLRDGDVVHLRPRADQLPPLDFDDLIDGVAIGISGRSDRWRPEMSRRLLAGLLGGVAGGRAGAAGRSPQRAVRPAGRRAGSRPARADRGGVPRLRGRARGRVLGGGAIAYAGLAGAEFPLLQRRVPRAGRCWPGVCSAPRCWPAASRSPGPAPRSAMAQRRTSPGAARRTVAGLLLAAGGAAATFGKLAARGGRGGRGDAGHAGGLLGAGAVVPAGEDAP